MKLNEMKIGDSTKIKADVSKDANKWWSSLSINEQNKYKGMAPFWKDRDMSYFLQHKNGIKELYEYLLQNGNIKSVKADHLVTPQEVKEDIGDTDSRLRNILTKIQMKLKSNPDRANLYMDLITKLLKTMTIKKDTVQTAKDFLNMVS
jgi:hypothetical protein